MSQQFVIKTKTDVLYSNVTQLNNSIQDIRKRYSEIGGLMANMPKYWLGDASDRHTKEVQAHIEEIEPVIEMLEQKPVQLLKIAGLYDTVEEANKGLAKTLDNDIIPETKRIAYW